MSEKFEASRGGVVVKHDSGELTFDCYGSDGCPAHYLDIGIGAVQALREFFQHERDEKLGRWRWPENPNYVVYPNPREDHELAFGEDLSLIILRESDGVMKGYAQDEDHHRNPDRGSGFARAARAYFLAHPESKPWRDAETGEVWALTFDGHESAWAVDPVRQFVFAGREAKIPLDHPSISAGRKVWPEVSDE